MITETMTLTDLKTAAKRRGYIAKKTDGEIEIYPKGKRGAASNFTPDADDAFLSMRADFVQRHTARIVKVMSNQAHHVGSNDGMLRFEHALITYAAASGRYDWTDYLARDWSRAGSATVGSDTYSVLHALRNHRDGHEILRQIEANH